MKGLSLRFRSWKYGPRTNIVTGKISPLGHIFLGPPYPFRLPEKLGLKFNDWSETITCVFIFNHWVVLFADPPPTPRKIRKVGGKKTEESLVPSMKLTQIFGVLIISFVL